jgi:chemotaxis protein methyltransferase CheR
MTQQEFDRFSDFIHSRCGIKMPQSKKTMLEARLLKRMRHLNLDSFAKYCSYVFSSEGMAAELVHMIDTVTTNKTEFFR